MNKVLAEINRGTAVITLNRPDVLNALDPDMARDLHQALLDASSDPAVGCIVLRGAGGGFMAGGDVAFFHDSLDDLRAGRVAGLDPIFTHVHGIIATLRKMDAPVVAALHGAVAGFGVSLAAACDIAVAAEDAMFTLAYCHIGASPDGGSSYFLPRVVGLKKAMELTLLGERFDARQALAMGLVNKVVPAADLDSAVREWALRFVQGPGFAYGKTKALLYESLDNTFEEQLGLEERSFKECTGTADFAEGVTAFVEKRKPRFG